MKDKKGEIQMSIGERILANRKRLKLSQEELSEKIGTSRQIISAWENGVFTPSTQSLIKLARVFECSLDELIGSNMENEDPMVAPRQEEE